MNMYRRNNFKSWFDDVGFLYVVVALFVAVVVLVPTLASLVSFRSF